MATTLTRKGQITVPKKIRNYPGLRPGSAVDFSLGPHGEVILRPAEDIPPERRKDRFGRLRGTLDTGRTTDEWMHLLRGYDADASDPGLK